MVRQQWNQKNEHMNDVTEAMMGGTVVSAMVKDETQLIMTVKGDKQIGQQASRCG